MNKFTCALFVFVCSILVFSSRAHAADTYGYQDTAVIVGTSDVNVYIAPTLGTVLGTVPPGTYVSALTYVPVNSNTRSIPTIVNGYTYWPMHFQPPIANCNLPQTGGNCYNGWVRSDNLKKTNIVATLTLDGGEHSGTYLVGTNATLSWSSDNANSFSSYYISSNGDLCGYSADWKMNTSSGSIVFPVQHACTYTITYKATDSARGAFKTDEVTITGVSGTDPNSTVSIAPSVPTNLHTTVYPDLDHANTALVDLEWNPSTGTLANIGYIIYRNGVRIGSSNTNFFSDYPVSTSINNAYTVASYYYSYTTSLGPLTVSAPSAPAYTGPTSAVTKLVKQTSSQTYYFANNLSIGSSGPDVVALQSLLMKYGYSIPALASGGTPGYFGSQTANAVASMQSLNGISPLGIVGPLTRALLNSGVIVAYSQSTIPSPTPIYYSPAPTYSPIYSPYASVAPTPSSAPYTSPSPSPKPSVTPTQTIAPYMSPTPYSSPTPYVSPSPSPVQTYAPYVSPSPYVSPHAQSVDSTAWTGAVWNASLLDAIKLEISKCFSLGEYCK